MVKTPWVHRFKSGAVKWTLVTGIAALQQRI
jgi:hypothetical protein